MAGGFGTRLRPLTCNIPKPMVPMANVPIMEHALRLLKKHGFEEAMVMLYYQPEIVQNYFKDGKSLDMRLKYFIPPMDLGTAGCVAAAASELTETFLVISGDLLTDFDLSRALSFHKEKNALATMVLTRVANPLPYGVVITEEDGRISRFLEKPTWGEVFSDTINTGIYILQPEVFAHIPPETSFDFSKNLFPKILAEGLGLYGFVAQGYWKDVGDLTEYRMAHQDILDGKISIEISGKRHFAAGGSFFAGEETEIGEEAFIGEGVILGKKCRIGPKSRVERSILGDGVSIDAASEIYGCVLWDGVRVAMAARLKESVVGLRTSIGARAVIMEGCVISDGCEIGPEALVKPNVKIWPKKRVEEGAILSSSLIWGERWQKALFGVHGISGLINAEITPEFAAKLGAAYGAVLGAGAYVITSRDSHQASRMIKRSLISGLLSTGVRVGDLRTAPIPVVRYEMGKEGEIGGVHVRQSPFDARLLDILFFDGSGSDIPTPREKAIEQLFLREDFQRSAPSEVGEIITPPRAMEYYRTGFLKTIGKEKLSRAKMKVVIDYAHSSASMIFPAILGALGLEAIGLNADLRSQRLTKTPAEFQAGLKELSTIVRTLKADAGFLIDTGAEKLFLADEKGRVLSDDVAALCVSWLYLKTHSGKNIAVPVTSSRAFASLAEASGAAFAWTKTSPRGIMEASRGEGIGFAADGIGGFIFPEFQGAFDAMFAIAKILEMTAEIKASLSEVVSGLPKMDVLHKKIPCPWDKKGAVMRRALEEAKGKNSVTLDGVRIAMADNGSWVLLIPDPDEAFFHIWTEAPAGKKILEEYDKKVCQWQR